MPENETQTHTMTDRVLGAITESGVAPKPRWHFLLREWVVWLVAGIALVVGSIATALTLYISEVSFFTERHIAMSGLSKVFTMLPYVWLVLLAVGVFYSVYALHTTKRGYRWHTSWLVGIAIGLSMGIGWGVHATGVSESLDRYLLAEMPMYHPLSGFDPGHWMNPNAGLVAGVVEQVNDESFVVRGLDGESVEVAVNASTTVHEYMDLREGVPVRVVGTTTEEEGVLEAADVRPFKGRGPGARTPKSNHGDDAPGKQDGRGPGRQQ